MKYPTFYRTTQIDGLSIFYREAGPKDAPTILLLHGLPSSSRMFEPLFARLSDRYHLIAPDYPGYGHSDWPDPKKFAYTFDHIAEIMNHFTEALDSRATHFTCRITAARLVFEWRWFIRNASKHLLFRTRLRTMKAWARIGKRGERFGPIASLTKTHFAPNLLSLATTRTRHVGDDPNVERYDPDLWTDEFYFLNQPGQADIQSDLFYDYRTKPTPTRNGRHGCARSNRAAGDLG